MNPCAGQRLAGHPPAALGRAWSSLRGVCAPERWWEMRGALDLPAEVGRALAE
jgi:hypothetical protein